MVLLAQKAVPAIDAGKEVRGGVHGWRQGHGTHWRLLGGTTGGAVGERFKSMKWVWGVAVLAW